MRVNDCFRALSDPVRREILLMLRKERKAASEICNHFELTNATVSYHLSLLKKAELIHEQREGKYIYYSISMSVCEEIILWLEGLKGVSL